MTRSYCPRPDHWSPPRSPLWSATPRRPHPRRTPRDGCRRGLRLTKYAGVRRAASRSRRDRSSRRGGNSQVRHLASSRSRPGRDGGADRRLEPSRTGTRRLRVRPLCRNGRRKRDTTVPTEKLSRDHAASRMGDRVPPAARLMQALMQAMSPPRSTSRPACGTYRGVRQGEPSRARCHWFRADAVASVAPPYLVGQDYFPPKIQ